MISDSTETYTTKLVAFYLPQFHPIPENDAWWGKGFTDWVNVKKATPLFKGHYQPRVPLGSRYYCLDEKETLAWQVDLAKQYGIYGFCHYHYWFDGKQLLERPTNLFLENRDLDLKICLAWANEPWSRRWDGRAKQVLQDQTHSPRPELWTRHVEYLLRFWLDPRAVKIDGKPVFLIYRPHRILELGNMIDLWRNEAKKKGLEGIYMIAMKQYEFPDPDVLKYFDAVVDFQPFEAIYSPEYRGRPEPRAHWKTLRWLKEELFYGMVADFRRRYGRPTFYDYDELWREIISSTRSNDGLMTFPGAFVDWDNTARYGRRSIIFRGANPEKYSYWLRKLAERTERFPPDKRLIFLNAWNEWAESTYLEPDQRYGFAYLEATKTALSKTTPKAHTAREASHSDSARTATGRKYQ